MNENGYILLHRKIQDNFIFKEKRKFSKLEAWIDILLNVSYDTSSVFIKNKQINLLRGELCLSFELWGNRWGWSKSKVRSFLKLLESENMITLTNEVVTTRLKVINYETYQKGLKRNNNVITEKEILSTYSDSEFLQEWAKARLHYDKKETNIVKLTYFESLGLEEISKYYTKKEVKEAIAGLFYQQTYETIRVRPTHFLKLENFEQYLNCWKSKTKLFTPKEIRKETI